MLFRHKPNSLSVEMGLSEQTVQHLAVLLFFHFNIKYPHYLHYLRRPQHMHQ